MVFENLVSVDVNGRVDLAFVLRMCITNVTPSVVENMVLSFLGKLSVIVFTQKPPGGAYGRQAITHCCLLEGLRSSPMGSVVRKFDFFVNCS